MKSNGPVVILGMLIFVFAIAFVGAFYAFNTRWRVKTDNLERRIEVLERANGIEPKPMPSAGDATGAR